MKLKRYPIVDLVKFYVNDVIIKTIKVIQSEPHKIVRCLNCDEHHRLEFRRSGDDQLYYKCQGCGFESSLLGECPAHIL